eukprot:comp18030_c1_seq1/m.18541 comp18030_c1_seq1/g.18541  ORF comp18030_c1_seq1/g.18541 comp18030_c1_seq1/m.18541 type:complete len:395 (-) comp18030_c1_seq1:457-1641(-)
MPEKDKSVGVGVGGDAAAVQTQLNNVLGSRAEDYWKAVRGVLTAVISKADLDSTVADLLGDAHVPLHNKFVLAVVRAACQPKPKPDSHNKENAAKATKKKTKRMRTDSTHSDGNQSTPAPNLTPRSRAPSQKEGTPAAVETTPTASQPDTPDTSQKRKESSKDPERRLEEDREGEREREREKEQKANRQKKIAAQQQQQSDVQQRKLLRLARQKRGRDSLYPTLSTHFARDLQDVQGKELLNLAGNKQDSETNLQSLFGMVHDVPQSTIYDTLISRRGPIPDTCVQANRLPTRGELQARMSLTARDYGLDGVDAGTVDMMQDALQTHLKNIIRHCIDLKSSGLSTPHLPPQGEDYDSCISIEDLHTTLQVFPHLRGDDMLTQEVILSEMWQVDD